MRARGEVADAALVTSARAALEASLGDVEVVPGARLSGSSRTAVMRASVHRPGAAPLPVVVKASLGAGDTGPRETAALRLLARTGIDAAVRLLADGGDPPVLVLADLGEGPTLVDRLMGTDAAAAEAAVIGWARALGDVQAATVGLRDVFAAGLSDCSPYGPLPVDTTAAVVDDAARDLERTLLRVGVTPSRAALDELRALARSLDSAQPDAPAGLAPGDTCPSNAIETGGRTVLLDFEGAEHRHLAWEAAYLRVPWPTCWCSWALPEPVAERALSAWREALSVAVPQTAAPAFEIDLRRASAVWAVASLAWLLPYALDGEPAHPDPVRRAATTPAVPVVQHRAALAATWADDAPAVAGLAEQVHAALVREWGRQPLAVAPAFA